MAKVYLEIRPSSLAETLGIGLSSEEAIADRETDGDQSIIGLLNRLSTRYRRFGQLVFDSNTQKLTGRVGIFLNGRALEPASGLATRLSDGDTLTFVPLIEGG